MIRIAMNDRVGTIDWVKGQPLPTDFAPGHGIAVEDVTAIEVSGDSIQLVYKMYTSPFVRSLAERYDDGKGYPRPDFIPEGETVRLYGDLAKTIIGNLRNVV